MHEQNTKNEGDYSMIYGYCRVSSRGQQEYGNGLDVQEAQVRAAGAEDVRREACTGTTMDRPQWLKLVSEVCRGDVIVVAKLDRIARTSSGGFEAVKELLAKGVAVHILNMGRVDDTPTGRLILNIMFAFAEFDRDMLVERMAEGRAAARLKPGYKEGRKRKSIDPAAFAMLASEVDAGAISVRKMASELGISERTCRRRLAESSL